MRSNNYARLIHSELLKSVASRTAIEPAALPIQADDDLNLQNDNGCSDLMIALHEGRISMARSLIDAGTNVNLQDNKGFSPLMLAAYYGYTDIVSLLIEAGADLNLQSSTGVSALIIAAKNGHTDIAKALIDNGANPNLQNNAEASALIAAADKKHIDIVKLLIENGADASVLNYKKKAFEDSIYHFINKDVLTDYEKKRLVKLYIIFRTVEETNMINHIESSVTAFFKSGSAYSEQIKAAENLLKALDNGQNFSETVPELQDDLLKRIHERCLEPGSPENLEKRVFIPLKF